MKKDQAEPKAKAPVQKKAEPAPGKRTPAQHRYTESDQSSASVQRKANAGDAQDPVQAKGQQNAALVDASNRVMFGKGSAADVQLLEPGLSVQAKGDTTGDTSSVQAAAAHGVQGGGQSLPHLDTIQSSFGRHDVSGVQAHVGGKASEATSAMGANAYATGNDVAFSGAPSLHTAAHEAAHVVQQRSGVQLEGGVGEVGDQYEQHADEVADKVVAGESAEALLDEQAGDGEKVSSDGGGDDLAADGAGPKAAADASVQMLSEGVKTLNNSAESHWYKSADGAKVIANFKALSPAERAKCVKDNDFDSIMRRVVKALNAFQMTQLFAMVPRSVADLRWKLYWLDAGGQISKMSISQWRWFLVYNSPSDWTKLRSYATGYKMFLKNCPVELIPPWDQLEGLEKGLWKGTKPQVRNAVNQLNAVQKTKVLASPSKLLAIWKNCGDAHETYRTFSYLNAPLRTLCSYLNKSEFKKMTDEDWGAMLGAATRAEVDDLATNDKATWAKVTKHCPASIIAVVRGATTEVDDGTGTGTKEAAVDKQLDDPVMVKAMAQTMGSTGFLSLCCTAKADATGNYAKVRTALKVAGITKIVNDLQPGQRMGDRTAAHLKIWFLAENASVPLSELMMGKRFNMTVGGTGAYNHNDSSTTIAPWTIPALKQSWVVLERLPPSNVENNPAIVNMLRNAHATGGSDGAAYYGSLNDDPNYRSGEVVMGYQNLGAIRTDAGFGTGVYSANGQGAGTAAVSMNVFNATLRHEIGHAVDRQLGIMDNWGSQESAGAWQKYGSYTEFVDAIIAKGGGFGTASVPKHSYVGADINKYRAAMIRAVTNTVSLPTALAAIKPTANVTPAVLDAGPLAAVYQTTRWTGTSSTSGPWYDTSKYKPQNGRCFQRAYGDAKSLWAFTNATRLAKGVTEYQWRAPGEWFAEVYQVYYAEQETGANAAVGGILRSRDKNAAELMSTVVDRGHSPQDMRGGKTEKAPGT